MTCQKGDDQEREEDHPVFSGFDTPALWRKEEIIQGQGSRPGSGSRLNKAPSIGNDQDREEQEQNCGGSTEVLNRSGRRGDGSDNAKRNNDAQYAAGYTYPMAGLE